METKKSIKVGGIELDWDLETGKVLFDGGDVVFFWVSAMKTFFDTIREISGAEATHLVLETTGFRQGIVVGEGYKKIAGIDKHNVIQWLSNTYAPAGWGKAVIKDMDEERGSFILHLQDDWEHKMNRLDDKKPEGVFVPAHYAGVFTGLFGQNYWYKIIQHQNEVNPYSIVEYFVSDITVQQNILEMTRRQEARQIKELEALVEDKTRTLQELIMELSSPLIPVLEGISVVPLIGTYDEQRGETLLQNTLAKLPAHKTRYLLLDLTGLQDNINTYTASLIEKLGAAARLLGTEVILVGISAELAMKISHSLINLRKFECLQSLQHGIYYALGKSGKRIV
ncbi:STAS domain-containing protein [Bacillus infantis]|uniref:STAS domain-containing protein n=1 Tax=Bacillus infantis TaxID=324767 RepID=UPI003CF777EB